MTDAPRWVGFIERARHIFNFNQAELTQITMLLIVGIWWLRAGDTSSIDGFGDLVAAGVPEEIFGVLLLYLGSLHALVLWRRAYRWRRCCAAAEAMFWFSLAVATYHGAPLSTMAPMAFVTGLSVLTTYWRLGGRK